MEGRYKGASRSAREHTMAGNTRILIKPQDVYELTDKGSNELRGAQTALTRQQLEVMVLIDGMASVEAVARSVRTLEADAVLQVVGDLVAAGLLRLATRLAGDALDFGALLSAKPAPAPGALDAASEEAGIGAASLQRQGYYVRIARRTRNAGSLPDGRKPTVIIIEDDQHLSKLLKTYLMLEGFEPRLATRREEVLKEFRSPPVPDLVVLDIMLPDADGFEILAAMRRHPVLKSVPVVMLTARATREAVQKGIAGGADGYITKPFEVDVLMAALKVVLGLP